MSLNACKCDDKRTPVTQMAMGAMQWLDKATVVQWNPDFSNFQGETKTGSRNWGVKQHCLIAGRV